MIPVEHMLNSEQAFRKARHHELHGRLVEARIELHRAIEEAWLFDEDIFKEMQKQRRDKGIADVTEVMAAEYRHEHRQ